MVSSPQRNVKPDANAFRLTTPRIRSIKRLVAVYPTDCDNVASVNKRAIIVATRSRTASHANDKSYFGRTKWVA